VQGFWNFVKAAVVLGVLGYVGFFIYQKSIEGPATREDVHAIAAAIAQIVGEEKTELKATDKPSVEFQAEKLKGIELQTIREGLMMFDPDATRAEYVAAELILLRIYEQRPDGYVSRIEGDPWDVSGGLTQMGLFEIDRTSGDADRVTEMVEAFGPSTTPRAEWASSSGRP
jgi:hypothetical protein